jgi:GT2 family glycosyltransferase
MKILMGLVVINRLRTTEECIQRILQFTNRSKVDLIVVDNGSDDCTKSMLHDRRKDFDDLIFNDWNTGCCFGINKWMSFRERGQSCIDINADVHLYSEWIKPMLEVLESDATIGVIAGRRPTFWLDRVEKWSMYKSGVVVPRVVAGHWIEQVMNNLIIGPFWLMRGELIDQIGFQNESNGYDDIDHGYRVQATGYKSMYLPEILMLQPQDEIQTHPQYGSHKALLNKNRNKYTKDIMKYTKKQDLYCGTRFLPETMTRSTDEYAQGSDNNWEFLKGWPNEESRTNTVSN